MDRLKIIHAIQQKHFELQECKPHQILEGWTPTNVMEWLTKRAFAGVDVGQWFAVVEVNGALLCLLKESDLMELGMASGLQRKIVMEHVTRLQTHPSYVPTTTTTLFGLR